MEWNEEVEEVETEEAEETTIKLPFTGSENIFEVKQRQVIADIITCFLFVEFIIDRCFLFYNFHPDKLFKNIYKRRSA